jgi:predicted O-linked N-acetylglucosamine transferase (SPINDLY family)
MAQGSLPEAIASFECALEIRTDDPATELSWLHLRQQIGHWEGVADAFGRVRAAAGRSTEPAPSPFWFLAVPGSTPAEQRRCAEVWGRAVAESVQATRLSPAQESDRGAGRIRLGYLSSDLNEHAVATVIAEVIELHDRHRFEVVGYSYGSDDGSAARRRLVRAFDRFVDVRPLSFVDAARHIREDGIDILIDLNGYTRHARTEIVALRPAPVQVSHLGYPGTMGAEFIDYLISDFFVTPPEAAGGYSEALAVLPDCYQPQDRQRPIGDSPPRATCGLPEDGFVFCCFNQPYKIAPDIFDVWCRLLQTVPGSVLWLWKANPWIEGNLRGAAAARGIAPDRLVFADYAPLAEHLARQQLADLFLDTFPYNAHATASHALWAGVPIVTRAGQTFASRVAGSLLRAAGLPELVTRTLDEYFQLSLNLATDRMALGRLRDRLAANRLTAPLFDTLRYVRNLEALYAEMHRRRVAGEAVRSIKPVASGSA